MMMNLKLIGVVIGLEKVTRQTAGDRLE
jgi:hypothetical protein